MGLVNLETDATLMPTIKLLGTGKGRNPAKKVILYTLRKTETETTIKMN